MTVFAPTDVASVTIPTDRGGCGLTHPVIDRGVTCPACEPAIIALRHGWAHTLDKVAPTCDERAEAEANEARAARQSQRTWADPTVLSHVIADAMKSGLSGAAPSAPAASLLAQVAALSAEERAAFAALLTATTPPVEAVDTPAKVVDGPATDDFKTTDGWGGAAITGTDSEPPAPTTAGAVDVNTTVHLDGRTLHAGLIRPDGDAPTALAVPDKN